MEAKKRLFESSSDDDDVDLGQIIQFKDSAADAESAIKTEKVYFTPDDGKQRLIVLLDNAGLEVARTKHDFQLLNAEDHENLIRKMKRDPSDFRPDLVH